MPKPRIAHFAGPNATIQNSPALITSDKARQKYGLPPRRNADGSAPRYDLVRPQRLALPVTVYVEQFSAHPLEADAAELYGPPDAYVGADGVVRPERASPDDKPVYEVTLLPDDGLYMLPYMARQADGSAWEEDCAYPRAPQERARQPFYPDGSRSFEEIDRFGLGSNGHNNLISSQADVDFYRPSPPAGYTKGLPASRRTDVGEGDIPPERRAEDFFPYMPPHIQANPPRGALASITNYVQRVLATGQYAGAIWTQGSPRIEETTYWFNLLLDTTLPICGNAAQRPHQMISNDGDKNLVDSVQYILSRVWADDQGRDRAGVVLVQEQQVFASRDVQKADARPGGYTTTGDHGGIIGAAGTGIDPTLTYLPNRRHTYQSAVNVTRLPREVLGLRQEGGRLVTAPVAVKTGAGELLEAAIPRVSIVKDGSYQVDADWGDPEREVDILACLELFLREGGLAGFVVEGQSPYGTMNSTVRQTVMSRAVYSGLPVVYVGRGNHGGFSRPRPDAIGGNNLTSTKARLLLMACLMKFGVLPPAADPMRPTPAERAAVQEHLKQYQAIFDTH